MMIERGRKSSCSNMLLIRFDCSLFPTVIDMVPLGRPRNTADDHLPETYRLPNSQRGNGQCGQARHYPSLPAVCSRHKKRSRLLICTYFVGPKLCHKNFPRLPNPRRKNTLNLMRSSQGIIGVKTASKQHHTMSAICQNGVLKYIAYFSYILNSNTMADKGYGAASKTRPSLPSSEKLPHPSDPG